MFTKIVNDNPYDNLGDYKTEADVKAINPQLLTNFDKWVKRLVGNLNYADKGSAKNAISKFESAIAKADFVEKVRKCQNGQATVDDVNKSIQAVYVAYNQLKADCEELDKSQKKPVDPPKDDKNGNQGSAGSSKRPEKDGEESGNWKRYAGYGLIIASLIGVLIALIIVSKGCGDSSKANKSSGSAKNAAVVNTDSLAKARAIDSLKAINDSLKAANGKLNEPPEWYVRLDEDAAKYAAEGENK